MGYCFEILMFITENLKREREFVLVENEDKSMIYQRIRKKIIDMLLCFVNRLNFTKMMIVMYLSRELIVSDRWNRCKTFAQQYLIEHLLFLSILKSQIDPYFTNK